MSHTAAEIAAIIADQHDAGRELLGDFVLRMFPHENLSTVVEALQICIERERVWNEFAALLEALKPVRPPNDVPDHSVDHSIQLKRQLGYDAEFEALVARIWVCPHCDNRTTIAHIIVPAGEPDKMPRCFSCGREGIAPLDDEPPSLRSIEGGKP